MTPCATAASTLPATVAVPAAPRMPERVAFYLLASITVSFMAGSSAPTPLYALYQAQWGFTATLVTVVFAVYAIAVLASLLVFGRLSDHVGRRPLIVGAIAVQLVSMLAFEVASSVSGLIAARVIQGLATGAAVAAVAGGLLDVDRKHGTVANSLTTPVGTALGAIFAGLLVRFLPAPTHLVYALLAAAYVVQAAGVIAMTETAPRRAGALGSLKPRLALSPSVRAPMLLAIPALIAVWAVAGFYASLGPSLVRRMLDTDSALVGSLGLFVLAASAAAATLLLRDSPTRTLMTFGTTALLLGLATATAALSMHSGAFFFLGTALAGMGFGAGFPGAIRTISERAAAHERAGVISVALVVSYLAMGVPAIAAGWLATRQGDILLTAQEFGAAVMAMSLVAFAGAFRKNALG